MSKGATDPILLSLQMADAVLQIASRIGGPRTPRSMFSERNGRGELPPERIRDAQRHAYCVGLVPDIVAGRVVALSMATDNARARFTIREVAKITGLSRTTAHRKLGEGLFFVGELMRCMFGHSAHREAA